MQAARLSCPNCSAPLRVRDRRFIGRQVDCPDCNRPMLVVADGHRGIALEAVAAAATEADDSAAAAVSEFASAATVEAPPERSDRFARWLPWWDMLKSPVGVAWTVAAAVALVFLSLLLPDEQDEPPQPPSTQVAGRESPEAEETAQAAPATWRQPVVQVDEPKQPAQPPKATRNAVPDAPGDVTQSVPHNADTPLPAEPNDVLFVAEVDAAPPVVAPQPLATVAALPEDDSDSPAEPEVPEEPVDVEAALAQPILSFRQANAAPAGDVLLQIEEMAGVPIEAGQGQLGAQYARLQETVALDLENTTVGEILDALLDRFGWSADVRDGKVYVVPGIR